MDTAAYRFDEGNFYGGDAPLSRTGRVDALTFQMLGVLRVFGMFRGSPPILSGVMPGCGRRARGAGRAMVRDQRPPGAPRRSGGGRAGRP